MIQLRFLMISGLSMAAALLPAMQEDGPVTVEALKQKAAIVVKNRDAETAVFLIKQAGEIGTVEAVQFSLRLVEKMKFVSKVAEAAERTITELDTPEVEEFVLAESVGPLDWRLRLILLGVVAKMKGERSFQIILQSLDDKQDLIQTAGAQGLGLRKDQRAVEPLIEKMLTLDRKKGVVWEHCQAALVRLTGQDLELGADFQTWWQAHGKPDRKAREEPKDQPPGAPEEPLIKAGVKRVRKDRDATFFGLKITCQKIVFIIDVSGSMEKKDPPPKEDQRTGTGNRPPPEPAENRRRILRAQNELIRTIRSLDSGVEFNIIAYSDEVSHWSRSGLRKATKDGREKAVRFVRSFKAEGTTWTDLAIEEAYKFNPEAYCFYLLSDGTPTHEGGEEPGDTEGIMEDVYQLIPELDIYRRVRIHALGFRDANVEFMEQLADMTGGVYKNIR